ncbi:hypothetical protein RB25_08425 [Herbaspirillum rubrisubalbicans]|uniref:Uncharacterized protein n=1 Tax=Herbaspirillum rubrisubalbicans TaxID=80842 RepID=A0ABX9C3R9_9BURK|nr:hypothetical protein [Herbaspirillum rubrisubalbicans]NQE49958.1 hypothetical protein [Herbaspirillum rubrisubalbicans]RAM65147.1 hypothetical protein RB24_07520 [Herbaspirillum rubrisubalbicans]RAN48779.1 hypothetical protein RB25_08425 [Herbaspirillum rubrisubalbicans]
MILRTTKLVLWACVIVFAIWYLARPTIVVHYAADADNSVSYFYDEEHAIIRDHLNPGQSVRFSTPMFPDADFLVIISTPFVNTDGVEITPPFSRVDVYIDAQAHFRVEKHHGFLDRF